MSLSENQKLAMRYMEIFFSGANLERLNEIFTPDLHFQGPFLECRSAAEYVRSLVADPPVNCHYEMIDSLADAGRVHLLYKFRKGSIEMRMSQNFWIRAHRIQKIILVFDTAAFRA